MYDEFRQIMEAYAKKFGSMRSVTHRFQDGLTIKTQAPVQTQKHGKIKFQTGLETVWLQIVQPNKPIVLLARLSELKCGEYEFELLALNEHPSLAQKHLQKLQKLVT